MNRPIQEIIEEINATLREIEEYLSRLRRQKPIKAPRS